MEQGMGPVESYMSPYLKTKNISWLEMCCLPGSIIGPVKGAGYEVIIKWFCVIFFKGLFIF